MDPRYEEMAASINHIVEDGVKKFAVMWSEIGYDYENKEQRCEAIVNHCQRLFDDMLAEEEENRAYIIKKIEEYLKEVSDLKKDLNVDIDVDGCESLPLNEVERMLRHRLQKYREIREQRVAAFAQLRNREKQLCDDLGIVPQKFTNSVLSEEQLRDFEKYLNEKDAEKERLLQTFRNTKSAIVNIMKDLELTPTLEFEKLVVCEEDSAFKVTKENMTMLRKFHQRLEHQLEEAQSEAAELHEKLSELWNRLHEDYSFRDKFLQVHKGHSLGTLKILREEIKRCEDLKRQNIQRFITEIRKELEDWWDRCFISEEERLRFLPYSSDCYTEDLLELHDLEVKKYQNFYQNNVGIFELAKERQSLWDKFLELEDKANDPDRLFHNRGGQLLLEEKERKKIQKELPKVEKQLLKLVDAYEKNNNQPIKFNGHRVQDIIENQWLIHSNRKEMQKEAKKMERTRQLEVESKLGAHGSTSKRKALHATTALPLSTKRRRLDENKACASQQRPIVSRNIFPPRADPSSNPDMTTYTDFQDHIEACNKETVCRSSIKPDRYLRERNTPAKTPSRIPSKFTHRNLKTPLVTPQKPPRKNIPSNPSTPRTVPRTLHANSPRFQRGTNTGPRLKAAKGKLPIII